MRIEIKKVIDISQPAADLLAKLEDKGYLEYRDNHDTYEEYVEAITSRGLETKMTPEQYDRRNESSSRKLADELIAADLIAPDYDAWHATYVITDLGEEVLEMIKKQQA
jgi:predicted transcriptional regulator